MNECLRGCTNVEQLLLEVGTYMHFVPIYFRECEFLDCHLHSMGKVRRATYIGVWIHVLDSHNQNSRLRFLNRYRNTSQVQKRLALQEEFTYACSIPRAHMFAYI